MTDFQSLRIALTQKEKEILAGEKDATLQKILTTVVFYGEALGAKKLVSITGKGHFVISHAIIRNRCISILPILFRFSLDEMGLP